MTESKKGSFQTLKTGAETLQTAAGFACGKWNVGDIDQCAKLLRQFESDCATLGRQAREILTDMAASDCRMRQ